MHPFFGFKMPSMHYCNHEEECDGAGLGWAGDCQNVLGKVGCSEMEFGGVDVHALGSGENKVCFLASQMRFMNIYM